MNMNIDISNQAETNLTLLARQQGIDPAKLVSKVLEEQFALVLETTQENSDTTSASVLDSKAIAAIAWLKQRIAEDATDDLDKIRKADAEVAELKRNLNSNRAATGRKARQPVSQHILLDSTPLGLLTKPTSSSEVLTIYQWALACLGAGHRVYVPEVIDYELRRELIRAGKQNSLRLLNDAKSRFWYLPITTDAMLHAADLWAQSRNSGQPTSSPLKLDINVILAAQALTLSIPSEDSVIVASDNAGHLSRFVAAALWSNITP